MTVGWETLDVGDQALIFNKQGVARIVDGPNRLFLFREKILHLQRYTANQNEYLVVSHRNGRTEHIKGPQYLFQNPIAHFTIEVRSMISLDANEALVVYRQDEKSNEVTRYVQYGPTLFMLLSNEWLHHFCWHGTDPSNKTQMLPNIQQFQKLQIIPDQFYYNVDEVRTADNALIRVKLMLFYELKDIETMLNCTKNPMLDFINCVCADVVAFASKYTYLEFMERSEELNNITTYAQLTNRSKKIGYEISKVVYRGYFAHDTLQQLHDGAVQSRTRLKIAYEKEEQEQEVTDMKMKNEQVRNQVEQKLEITNLVHQNELQMGKVTHRLEMELKKEEDKKKQWQSEKKGELQAKMLSDDQKLKHYGKLHGLGVGMDQYLSLQNARPEKIIRIVADKNTANFHLHHT